MDVTPLVRQGTKIIQSYAGGSFKVSGESCDGPVIVTPDHVERWGVRVSSVKDLTAADFDFLAERADKIDVILLGTGKAIQFLSSAQRAALKEQGLSVEVMDTGAACRTYNVLVAEGRRVAAALLPV